MPAPATIEAYLAALSEQQRTAVEQIRAAVRAGAPNATETIAYGMPALRMGGRFLVSYAAFKGHYSLFPASDGVVHGLGDEVAHHVAGRGTLQFPAGRPIPADLITRIVRIRVGEEAIAAAARSAAKPGSKG